MAVLKVSLITPNGTLTTFETELLNFVTEVGAMGIMANHTPLVVTLKISRLWANVNKKHKEYAVAGGLLSLKDNEVMVVSNAIEDIETIDIDRALAAKQRALHRLESKQEDIDIKRAQLALARAINRLN